MCINWNVLALLAYVFHKKSAISSASSYLFPLNISLPKTLTHDMQKDLSLLTLCCISSYKPYKPYSFQTAVTMISIFPSTMVDLLHIYSTSVLSGLQEVILVSLKNDILLKSVIKLYCYHIFR